MAVNLKDHMYAADARTASGFGDQASIFVCESNWGTDNLSINSQHRIFKAARACFVSNFSLVAEQLDAHATPTITLDVGTDTDDDEFIAATTVAQAGGTELTNVVDESTEAGFPLAAGEYIIISLKAASATAQAGKTTVRFTCHAL